MARCISSVTTASTWSVAARKCDQCANRSGERGDRQEVKALQHPHHRDLTGRDGDGTAEQRHRAGRRERVRKHHEEFGIPADSFARAVAFAISQPEEMDVSEIVFRGTREEF